MAVSPADDAVADRLRTAELEVVGRFTTASNATLLCRLLDGPTRSPAPRDVADLDPDELCVYKPRRGEAPLWDFPDGTLYRREVAAFEVDRLLGWGLVPVTVEREEAPFGPGAVQAYVAHDPERHYFWLVEEGLEEGSVHVGHQLMRMVLFDLVIDNADRKGGHVLLTPDGSIRLVDHGVSFNVEPKLRTVAWHFAGAPVPRDDREDVARLRDALRRCDPQTASLRGLLDDAEIERLVERADAAARLEVFPEPTGPRPYPWPLL